MDNLDFIHECGQGSSTATLKAVLPSGQVCHVADNIDPYRFIEECPLLFHAFECGHRGRLEASLDVPSKTAIVSLLRYCYTGDYLDACAHVEHPTLLLHVHLYKIAVRFDIPELQRLIHGNFACQMETAACLPRLPQHLLDTIRFIYEHFDDSMSPIQHGLVNILRNYCISTYIYHKLGMNKEFLNLISEIPAFHQDLCRTVMERDFVDDCAAAIVCLPAGRAVARPSSTANTLSSRDLPEEMLYHVQSEPPPDNVTEVIKIPVHDGQRDGYSSTTLESPLCLVHCSRASRPVAETLSEYDSTSDEDGFVMIHGPQAEIIATPDELIPSHRLPFSMKTEIPAVTGSQYVSDDEWYIVEGNG